MLITPFQKVYGPYSSPPEYQDIGNCATVVLKVTVEELTSPQQKKQRNCQQGEEGGEVEHDEARSEVVVIKGWEIEERVKIELKNVVVSI